MSQHVIFTYEQDGVSFPVGVAVWDSERKDFAVKFLKEEVPGVNLGVVSLVEDKVRGWMKDVELPYSPFDQLRPYHDEWWRYVKGLLIHNTKMSSPRAIDSPSTSTASAELLFKHAVVGRIDVVLRRVWEISKQSLN